MIPHVPSSCGVPVGVECHRIANRGLTVERLQA